MSESHKLKFIRWGSNLFPASCSPGAGFTYVYPAMQERSKRYQHDLHMYGGKEAVLADDINRWFVGLGRGQTLAYTVAVLCTLTAIGSFAAARNVHPDVEDEREQEEGRA